MIRQPTLDNYFQSKSSLSPLGTNAKKRSLSLKRTPCKSLDTPGVSPRTPIMSTTAPREDVVEVKKEEEVICVSSDSEHEPTPSKRRRSRITVKSIESMRDTTPVRSQSIEKLGNSTGSSKCSQETFVYNLSPTAVLGMLPSTPKSSPSSSAKKKFYSPTKKRAVNKKSAVMNLTRRFNENISPNSSVADRAFAQDEDNDYKTGFLLSIIDKFLKSDTLKPLLEDNSLLLLEKCMQVAKPGMRVMCRLYWRQPVWYRIKDLEDIATKNKGTEKETLTSADLYNMISNLKECGLITQAGTDGETNLEFDDYVNLLKRDELVQIAKELKIKKQSKQDTVDALRAYSKSAPITNFFKSKENKVNNNSTRVLEILKSKTGDCYKMSDLARTTFHNLYVLMYLGIDYTVIRERKLELMLLNEKIKRETFPVDKGMVVDDASVVFQDKEEFNRYLQAHVVYENYVEQTDLDKKCELIKQAHELYKGLEEEHMIRYKSLPTWLRRFAPPNIYVKMLESGVQELKKQKTEEFYNLAVEMLDTLIGQIAFRQHKKALWYAEKALILHRHLDSSEKAAKVLLKGFKSEDLTEEMKDAMRPRALMIAKQQNIDLKEGLREKLRSYADKETILESNLPGEHIYKQPIDNYNQRGKLKFEMHTKEGRSTLTCEEYCVAHYLNSQQYTDGEHWEGRIVSTIFFLLFWDIIYSKPRGVTGIFMSHYQRYPLDMFSEHFYLNRKTLIDEKLMFIQECSEEMLLAVMQANWEQRPKNEITEISIEWELVREVTSCLRARGVAAVCRRLASNYGYAKSGFPDLTLWNKHTKKIKFVEVKTDADKPSIKQLQWLQYLLEHGVDAGFCYVGGNTTRSRARPAHSSD